MGVRIKKTPSSGKKRGCWAKSAFVVALTAYAVVVVSCGKPSSTPEQLYRGCVGVDHSPKIQDLCQRKAWGQTFGEEDPRWLCDVMGNWLCGDNPSGSLKV